jgi:hypothetical protein
MVDVVELLAPASVVARLVMLPTTLGRLSLPVRCNLLSVITASTIITLSVHLTSVSGAKIHISSW